VVQRGIVVLLLATLAVGQSAVFAQRGRPIHHPEPTQRESKAETGRSDSAPTLWDRRAAALAPSLSHISSIQLPNIVHPLLRDIATTARDVQSIKGTDGTVSGRYGTIGDREHPVRYRLDADPQKTALINRYLSAPINPKMALLPLFDPKADFGILQKLGKAWSAETFRGKVSIDGIEAFFAAHQGETVILVSHINATTRSFDILGRNEEVVASVTANEMQLIAGSNHVTLMIIGCSSLSLGHGIGVPQPISTNDVVAMLPGLLAARTRLDLHRLTSTPDNPVAIDPELLYAALNGLQAEIIQRLGDDGVYRPVIVILPPPNFSNSRTPEFCTMAHTIGDYEQCMESRFDLVFDNASYRAVDLGAREALDVKVSAAATARVVAAEAAAASAEATKNDLDEAESSPGYIAILGKIAMGGVLALSFAIGLLNAVWQVPSANKKGKP
jgi:hypothetical protein